MNITLLSYIRCPYCRGTVRKDFLDGDFGIISCACDKYPIVAGILYLQKNDALVNKRAVSAISRKQYSWAFWLVLSGSRIQKIVMYCVWTLHRAWGISFSRTKGLELLKAVSANKSWFDYLLDRKNSHDLSIATNILRRHRMNGNIIVDIGCGIGSLYENIPAQANCTYIGIEKNFLSLLFARLSTAGDAVWVCSDIEQGIPIFDTVATDVVFVDCFAWIYHKERALAQTKRVLAKNGIIAIVNIYTQTQRTRLWGYGVSPERLQDMMKKYFRHITFFNNNRSDRIIGLPIPRLHTERYSCKAIT